jgi:damage-control phosphatase, subfamily I
MDTFLECVPCLIRQSLESARLVTSDERIHEQVLREVSSAASRMNLKNPPPVMGQWIHRRIREMCAASDPYRGIKDRFNRLALELYAGAHEAVERVGDRWGAAVRLAIAGNVIDLGTKSGLTEAQVRAAITSCLTEPLEGDLQKFAAAVDGARRILYLTDNAGEIVFDRLLLEQMPLERVTVAVRGAPVINDATIADAEAAGLPQMVRVIDNGSDAPGTVLDLCSDSFRRCFDDSDLIIAKGQGNYETLRECPRQIYFLLQVKCPVIARDTDSPIGRMVLRPS